MKQLSRPNRLILLLTAAYFVSYLTRNNFAAVVIEVADSLSQSRAALSVCFTCSFITYGAGQILSGWCGDKISPKRLVLYGLFTTSAVNVLITFFREPWIMALLWSINGLAQAFLWPPMVKLLSMHLSENDYQRGVVFLSNGGMVGSTAVYLLAPLLFPMFGWKGIFYLSAFCGLLMMLLWHIFCPKDEEEQCTPAMAKESPSPTVTTPLARYGLLLTLIMAANIAQGIMRDGVTAWVPSYISDVFHLANDKAILISIALPLLGILGIVFSSKLHARYLRNPITCGLFFFSFGLASTLGLYFFRGHSAIADAVLMGTTVATMHAVNVMLIGMVPSHFAHTGRISLISGLLNSCTYVGSAISTYGVAVLSEQRGWTVTIGCWTAILLLGILLCLACLPLWRKHRLTKR